ncbi:sensor histidine kinase [Streptomyces sp. NPDC048172]|uniref:sensor histidine kinase n=1 Tax=Streptomyces sp. NPDC048172 TaxID=3365505 RepID=UPI003724A46E
MSDLRRIQEHGQRLRGAFRRLPFEQVLGPFLGLVFLIASFVPDFHSNGTQVGGVPDRPFDWLAVVAIVLQCAPLAVVRRWPTASLALVSLGFAADQLRGYHTLAGTGMALTVVGAGACVERHRGTVKLGFTLAYVPLAIALHMVGPSMPASEFVMFYLAVVLAWGIGAWLRATRSAEAERRRRVAEETRTAERTRIARELHDVVAHHVTAMVVQAEAARYLTASPERLDQTLNAVTDTGRRAVTDLRHLLDLLNPDYTTLDRAGALAGAGDRTPSVGRLPTLVEQTRQAGQPVEFSEEGTPAESTGSADLVAYRVVQEALTNALKYAHGSPTSVDVRHGEREISVEIGTDGSGARAAFPAGSGRGLAGARERVELLGGDFSAGPRPGGTFVVRARIPAGGAS